MPAQSPILFLKQICGGQTLGDTNRMGRQVGPLAVTAHCWRTRLGDLQAYRDPNRAKGGTGEAAAPGQFVSSRA